MVQAALGRGPMLRHYDVSMITNWRFQKLALDTAHEKVIPVQESVRSGGGTDGAAVNLEGVVRADKVENKDGIVRIVSTADVSVNGTITAGAIEIGGRREGARLPVDGRRKFRASWGAAFGHQWIWRRSAKEA